MIGVDNNKNEYMMEVRKPGQESQRMKSKCETDKEEIIIERYEF